MVKNLLITNCKQLVTLAGAKRPRVGTELRELAIVEDGAMLVSTGRIDRVGRRHEIEATIGSSTEVIDIGGRIVLPGFVDAHTHPVFAGNRADEFEERASGVSYQEIAARGGGIQSTVNRTRAASLDDLIASGRRYAQWFLRGGTTTVEAKSGYGLSLEDEMKMLRAIKALDEQTPLRYVPTFLGAHTFPAEYRSRRDPYISLLIDEMIPRVTQDKLAEFCDVFCEQKVFTTEESWKILSAARCHGLGLRIHADQLSLSGGAKLAAELGTVTADHLEHTDAEGIAGLEGRSSSASIAAGFSLRAGFDALSGCARDDRCGVGCGVGDRFQSRFFTNTFDADGSLAGVNAHEDDGSGINHGRDNQRRLQFESRRQNRIARAREDRRLCDSDCDDYRELGYFFGVEHPWKVFAEGREVVSR